MPSPFPGMDPYLESPDIWEDFHASLAWKISVQLAPRLRPRYYAALTPRVTYEEISIEQVHGVKPDVSVLKVSDRPMEGGAVAIEAAPLTGIVTFEVPVKDQTVEIRESGTGTLVTSIEILSPWNKRPGHEAFDAYRKKRRSAAHLMEIDLLRAGKRPPIATELPDAPYFVVLSREERRPRVEIWPLRLQKPIPVLPVPLVAPDPDVPIDLGKAIEEIYAERAFDLRIDYSRPPPKPDLPPEDAAWVQERIGRGAV
ncbi:MAG: DUF4058 family protein [Planctomycetes bacterium]|nr:DUF4058 family protein [Planctomycetota bacterium]